MCPWRDPTCCNSWVSVWTLSRLWVLSIMAKIPKFRSEFKWKGPLRFLLTGIFGITSGGGPHISVGIFRPKFAVPFLTSRFFALIREFRRRIWNDKSHFYWLVQFDRKMSFHFTQVFPLISERSIWHNGKQPLFPLSFLDDFLRSYQIFFIVFLGSYGQIYRHVRYTGALPMHCDRSATSRDLIHQFTQALQHQSQLLRNTVTYDKLNSQLNLTRWRHCLPSVYTPNMLLVT